MRATKKSQPRRGWLAFAERRVGVSVVVALVVGLAEQLLGGLVRGLADQLADTSAFEITGRSAKAGQPRRGWLFFIARTGGYGPRSAIGCQDPACLGSQWELSFDTGLGSVFVVASDLSHLWTLGDTASLSLGQRGVSVVAV